MVLKWGLLEDFGEAAAIFVQTFLARKRKRLLGAKITFRTKGAFYLADIAPPSGPGKLERGL